MWLSYAATVFLYGTLLAAVLLSLAAMRATSAKLMLAAALFASPFLLYTIGYAGTRVLSPAILVAAFVAALAFAFARPTLGRVLALPFLVFATLFVLFVLTQDWFLESTTVSPGTGDSAVHEYSYP